jgi:hypothetical protein
MSTSQALNGVENDALNRYPFHVIDGVVNFRDIGGYPSANDDKRVVKKGIVFRSGEPTRVTEKGKEALKALGIRKVFDLRSDREIAKYQLPQTEIEGIEFERCGVDEQVWYDPISLEVRYAPFVLLNASIAF